MSSNISNSLMVGINPGTVLDGRYEILGMLGEGGFAMVYRARQLNIQRDVAIKVLNQTGVDPRQAKSFEERFLREARTAAQINHANVVNIFDFGFTNQLRQPYIAMELLEGHDLEVELQQNGPMTPERAIPLFCEALEALGEAHKLGIVHKDLKPSNLFLCLPGTRREVLKIVDFGIARLNEGGNKKLTGTGQILGTPQYLAPEYIQNQTATPALDVYQMGLILVEMLTGRAVVDHENPYQCLMTHGSGSLEVPTSLVSGPLGGVILKALEHDHTARFHNADEFHDALAKIDISTVPPIEPAAPRARISEVSGSLRAVAISGVAETGEFSQPNQGAIGRSATVVGERGGMLGMAPTGFIEQPGVAPRPQGATSQPMPAPASPSKLPLVLGAVAVFIVFLLVAGAGAFFLMGDSNPKDKAGASEKPAPAAATTEQKDDEPAEVADKAPAPEKDDKKEAAPIPPVEPGPEPVEVALVPTPAEAEVFVNDQPQGKGEVKWTFDSNEAKAVTIRVEAEGYETHEAELAPGDGPRVEIALEKQRRAAANNRARPTRNNVQPTKVEAPKVETPKIETPKVNTDKPKERKGMGFVE